MEDLLLSIHVVAGIVFVGGSAVATSLFPRYVPLAATAGAPAPGGERNRGTALALHRITRGYALFGIVVPVVGIVLALVQGRMAEIWVNVAMVLTALAGVLLAWQIHPRQREALREPGEKSALGRLSMWSGIYNLVWAAVVVLMIVRPGSGS
ncbi:hypothetical protein ACFVWN_28690 [Nocardiopsis flavescens]|uniref:DUF2269 family protein n=1 Tax=Nocardiopsis flavescens TaxID=758803 RepID=A0A1M6U5Y3_9ACTN|nr:hypothetical protein [Nocardiopsis flavescens]SHK64580.1 hypothetical protein SAMN05421803_12635 [Nocardiopsis flavescens]